MKKSRLALLLITVIMVISLVLTACSSDTTSSDPSESIETSDNAEVTEEDKVEKPAIKKGEKLKIGISINALNAINNREVYDLQQQKAKEAGHEVIAVNADGIAVQQVEDVENLIQHGCDVIIIQNGDTDALTNVVKEASSKGIHVISVESGWIPGISAMFAKNDFALGANMYLMLAGEMGYEGEVILVNHNDHPAIRARRNVQEAILKEYPSIKAVNTVTSGYPGTIDATYKGVESALQQNPNVKAIWCTFDLEAIGAAQACKAAGKDDILIVGADGEIDVLNMIKDGGPIIATSVADLEETTTKVLEVAEKLAAGEEVAKFNEMPFTMITKDNVDFYIEKTLKYLESSK